MERFFGARHVDISGRHPSVNFPIVKYLPFQLLLGQDIIVSPVLPVVSHTHLHLRFLFQ